MLEQGRNPVDFGEQGAWRIKADSGRRFEPRRAPAWSGIVASRQLEVARVVMLLGRGRKSSNAVADEKIRTGMWMV